MTSTSHDEEVIRKPSDKPHFDGGLGARSGHAQGPWRDRDQTFEAFSASWWPALCFSKARPSLSARARSKVSALPAPGSLQR